MKFKLIAILMLLVTQLSAQTWNVKSIPQNQIGTTRGNYGTVQPFNYQTGSPYTIVTNTVTAVSSGVIDTVISPPISYGGFKTDSAIFQFQFPNKLDVLFDLSCNRISGTIAGSAIVYGSTDNSSWHALTSTTATCTGCVASTATLTGTGTTHYQWHFQGASMDYPYYMVLPVLSGTCSATFSCIAGYKW